jgi:hypothetical protein
MPKTRFFFEYDFSKGKYFKALSDGSDYKDNRFFVGVKGKVAGKTSGVAKFGYEHRKYRDQIKYNGMIVNIDLDYK